MKKIALFAAAIAGLSLTSCKKDYTCQCYYNASGSGGSASTTAEQYTFHETKSDAESKCSEKSVSNASGSASKTCSLK